MKIEKLTEDKIRVIINSNELNINKDNSNNSHLVMTKAIESKDFFLNILNKAEKEVDFNTDGCKLLIELFPSSDDLFVFTITKYIGATDNLLKNYTNTINNLNINNENKVTKKVIAKRKTLNNVHNHAICLFDDFNTFCDFCHALKTLHKIDWSILTNNSILYLWKDCYYLILKDIDIKSKNSFLLYTILSEFTKNISFSKTFESKLTEYGEIIINNNAIDIGISFFTN